MAKIGPSDVPGKKAGPNGSFPIGDAKHAQLALDFVGRSEAAGHITPEQAAHIRAAAHAKLAEHHRKLGKMLRK